MEFYRPQRSWAKVMFLQVSVILSTRGGVCLSGCWDARPPPPPWAGTPPPGRYTPQAGTPPREGTPPGQAHRLQDMVYERPVRILLECILVLNLNECIYFEKAFEFFTNT